jgi:sugar-specific transcriptional regulator TrmB
MERNKQKIIETLQEVGLSDYQSKVYVELLTLGTASAMEIAEASDVPDARVYDVLRDLDDFGYVELYEQDTFKARVIDPEDISKDLTEQATKLEDTAQNIQDLWQQPRVDNNAASLVKRIETILEAAQEYISEADTQIHAILTPEQFEKLRDDLAMAFKRGVTINVTLVQSDIDNEWLPDNYKEICTEIRQRPEPAPFLLISDLRRTAFSPNPAVMDEYGIVLENQSFSFVFFWHFLSVNWLPCKKIYTSSKDQTPRRYASIRQFLLDYEPLIDEDTIIEIEVEGREVETGQEITYAGTIVGANHTSDIPEWIDSKMLEMTAIASLVIDTGEELINVGGWGATREDVEARRITVIDVRKAEESSGKEGTQENQPSI